MVPDLSRQSAPAVSVVISTYNRCEKLPHALPMAQGGLLVMRPRPLGCPRVPSRRLERFTGLLEMLSDQRGTLIQLVGVKGLQRASD